MTPESTLILAKGPERRRVLSGSTYTLDAMAREGWNVVLIMRPWVPKSIAWFITDQDGYWLTPAEIFDRLGISGPENTSKETNK